MANQAFKYNHLVGLQDTFVFSMVGIGFIIKFGVVPAHLWIADVYTGIPLYMTA
jgi:NADH:ubiquinone oxidoreductase subunit 2 (subunit N)